MYKEFEVKVDGRKEGEETTMTIIRGNMAYYRPFVETSEKSGGKDRLAVMVYMVGSIKGIKVNHSVDDFKRLVKEAQ